MARSGIRALEGPHRQAQDVGREPPGAASTGLRVLAVAKVMESAGVPAAQFMLAGAIVFLIAGSLSVIVGYRARIGAALLLAFLVLASYYFHLFWRLHGRKRVRGR